ncbi:MAG: hypothetical protein ACI4XF_08300 [Oscillospiraceae bacterium]
MAINLNKDAYPNRQGQTSETPPIREVFPTYSDTPNINGRMSEDGEIYPVREIYPQPPPQTVIEEETAAQAPAENPPISPPKRKSRRKNIIIYVACTIAFTAAGIALKKSADNNSSEYSCYRTEWINLYSSEGISEVVINGDDAVLTVEIGEKNCDIEFGTITGNMVQTTMLPRESEHSVIFIDLDCVEIEDAYCAKDPCDVTLTLPENYKGSVKLIGNNSRINCGNSSFKDMSVTDSGDGQYILSIDTSGNIDRYFDQNDEDLLT